MNSEKKPATTLKDPKINIKVKLSALWATCMFLFVYVDIFGFYMPGVIDGILKGKVWVLEITQAWALGALVLMIIPSLMVFLSLALKAKANRWTNLIVGVLYIVVVIGNIVGETWPFYIVGTIVEAVLLVLIVWYAWKWPKAD